jgi:hypothetical protein
VPFTACGQQCNNSEIDKEYNSVDNKVIDEALTFVRKHTIKSTGEVPEWGKYQKLVQEHLRDEYNLKVKVPKEYVYAYHRGKGLSDKEALERMALGESKPEAKPVPTTEKKSSWKFW